MDVKKININQSEQTYDIASDIYDVTANNNDTTFSSLSELLSSENLSTLIPSTVRCGGMTIRFVQSSDNKYVQYRLMTTFFSTTENDWQDAAIIGTDRIADNAVITEKINFQQVTYPADGVVCQSNGEWYQYLAAGSMVYQNAKGTIILRGYKDDICTLIGMLFISADYYNIILFDSVFNEVGLYKNDSEEFSEYFSVTENKLHKLVLNWNYILTLNENARFIGISLNGNIVKISSQNGYQWATSISIYDKKFPHITTNLIKNGAVTTDKLADGAVKVWNLASGSVTIEKIANGAVTGDKIATGTITEDKIAGGVIPVAVQGVLNEATWYCCGDSFSEGAFQNSLTPDTSYKFQDGKYKGLYKVYSRFIAIRNNMNLQLLAKSGATLGLRKNSINWGADDFNSFTDIPYSPSNVTFNSSSITSVVLKNPSDEDAGCCSFMSHGDNLFTYDSSLGWVYNSEQSATDISKFLTITGSPNTGDTITVTNSVSNNGFYNQFRKIEADKTEDEQRKFNGYITSWFGINDSGACKLGSITDETLDTFYGSLNWWAINIIQKFPLAHIGFIVTNKCNSTFKQAIRDVAQKWAIPYLDMDGDIKVPSVSGTRDSVASQNIQVDPRLATYRWNNTFMVSPSNEHPNEFAHEWQSTFIENWLRTL